MKSERTKRRFFFGTIALYYLLSVGIAFLMIPAMKNYAIIRVLNELESSHFFWSIRENNMNIQEILCVYRLTLIKQVKKKVFNIHDGVTFKRLWQ